MCERLITAKQVKWKVVITEKKGLKIRGQSCPTFLLSCISLFTKINLHKLEVDIQTFSKTRRVFYSDITKYTASKINYIESMHVLLHRFSDTDGLQETKPLKGKLHPELILCMFDVMWYSVASKICFVTQFWISLQKKSSICPLLWHQCCRYPQTSHENNKWHSINQQISTWITKHIKNIAT